MGRRRGTVDGALTGGLALWALASLLPLAAWTGVTDRAYYATSWNLWWPATLVALLGAALALLFSRGAIAGLIARAGAAAVGVPRGWFIAVVGAAAGLEA